jgi:hypothetical protein
MSSCRHDDSGYGSSPPSGANHQGIYHEHGAALRLFLSVGKHPIETAKLSIIDDGCRSSERLEVQVSSDRLITPELSAHCFSAPFAPNISGPSISKHHYAQLDSPEYTQSCFVFMNLILNLSAQSSMSPAFRLRDVKV